MQGGLDHAEFYRRLQLLLGTFIPARFLPCVLRVRKTKPFRSCKKTRGRAKPIWSWRSSSKSSPGFLLWVNSCLWPYLTLACAADGRGTGSARLWWHWHSVPVAPGHRTLPCQLSVTIHTRSKQGTLATPSAPLCWSRNQVMGKCGLTVPQKKKKKLKTPSFLMLWSFVLTNLDIGQRLSEHEIVDAKLHRSLCKFTLNEIFLTSYNYKWFVLIWKILCSL